MSRPHTEFIFAQALPWRDTLPRDGVEEAQYKLLSHDDELGESSSIARFVAGWSANLSGEYQKEIYVLDGELSIGGIALQRDGYFRVPSRVTLPWSTRSGVTLLLLLNLPSAEDDAALVAIDAPRMQWDRSGVPEKLQFMGIARKALHVDRDSGFHRTWLLSVAPQIAPDGELLATETHGCAEEMFMLSGDITGPHGEMTAGAYFWRPRDTSHGPFGSRNGGLALARFRHGQQTTTFHELRRPFTFEAPYRPALAQDLAHLVDLPLPSNPRY